MLKKERTVSVLASDSRDSREMLWRLCKSEWVSLQLFSKFTDTFYVSDGLRELDSFFGSSYCDTAHPQESVWSG